MGVVLARLSRRTDDADLDRESCRFVGDHDPAHEFERSLPDVDRQPSLFRLGSQWPLHTLRLRSGTRDVKQMVENPRGFDIVSASSNTGEIVYSKFDPIHLYDPSSHTDRAVPITIADEMPELRPNWVPLPIRLKCRHLTDRRARGV